MRMYGISIIIPTTCSKHREKCLLRAIDSVLNQVDVCVEVIVVVNGNGFDYKLLEQLKLDTRLAVFYLSEGNVSRARFYGIKQSKYNFFAFLDDDDELLQNTLKARLYALVSDRYACVVVFNGYFFNGQDMLLVDNAFYQSILGSIELSFLDKNWFPSPAALYRKDKLDLSLFDMSHQYFELTYIFFKLIEEKYKLVFINQVAYRCFQDSFVSASKSEAYRLAYPEMLRIFINMNVSNDIKNKLKRRYVISLNSLSNYYLNKNNIKKSIYFHIKCLLAGGVEFIPYTRKLILGNKNSKYLDN